jgi:hypothetical protein
VHVLTMQRRERMCSDIVDTVDGVPSHSGLSVVGELLTVSSYRDGVLKDIRFIEMDKHWADMRQLN